MLKGWDTKKDKEEEEKEDDRTNVTSRLKQLLLAFWVRPSNRSPARDEGERRCRIRARNHKTKQKQHRREGKEGEKKYQET